MLAECFGNRRAGFHIQCRFPKNSFIGGILDDRAGDLEATEHLYSATKHRREVVGYPREVQFLVDAADDRHL